MKIEELFSVRGKVALARDRTVHLIRPLAWSSGF